MTAFTIEELVTSDISTFDVGQMFMEARQRGGNLHSIGVRCAAYDDPPYGTFLMATPEGLSLHAFRKDEPSHLTAVKLEVSDVRFELSPESTTVAVDGRAAGLLIVNGTGAFLSVKYTDPRYMSTDLAYVNLSDWTQGPYAPTYASGFAEWKLVATQYGKRVVLFESTSPAAQTGS